MAFEEILITVAIISLVLSSFIQAVWGYLTIKEGRQNRAWRMYIHNWEFSLGGVLLSSTLMFLFFAIYAINAIINLSRVPDSVWIYTFVILSINILHWYARAGYLWYTRRFTPTET